MKKTYVNRLPKNMEASSVNAKVVDGEIIVEVEMEEKFQPMFGDIVRIVPSDPKKGVRGYMICIWPNEIEDLDVYQIGCFNIANIDYAGNLSYECSNGKKPYSELKVFPASDSDMKELFEKLRKAGKRWNPETKKIGKYKMESGETLYLLYSSNWRVCSRKKRNK